MDATGLKASNAETNDGFGSAISLSGETLAVSATSEDGAATGIGGNESTDLRENSGAVYVFVRSGVDWTQQVYIKASNTEAQDLFGRAVSVSGDTLAVGAPNEDSDARGIDGDQTNANAPQSARSTSLHESVQSWTQQAYIKASNSGQSHTFGTNLSLQGDVLAVGAAGEDSAPKDRRR